MSEHGQYYHFVLIIALWITILIPGSSKIIFTPITDPTQLKEVSPEDNYALFSTAITQFIDPTDNEKYYYISTTDNTAVTVFDIYDNNLTQYNNQKNANLSDNIPYVINKNDSSYLAGISVCTTPKSGNIIECTKSHTTYNSTCRIFINGLNQWTDPFEFQQRNAGSYTPAVGTICLDDDTFLIISDDRNDLMQLKYTILSIDKHQQIVVHSNDTLTLDASKIGCTDAVMNIQFQLITKSNFNVNGDNVLNTLLFPYQCKAAGAYYSFSGYVNKKIINYELSILSDSYNALDKGVSMIPTNPIILPMSNICCYLFAYYYQEDIINNPKEAGIIMDYKGNNVGGGIITFDTEQVEPRYAFVNLEMLNNGTDDAKYFAEIGAIFT
eukprot:318840_1